MIYILFFFILLMYKVLYVFAFKDKTIFEYNVHCHSKVKYKALKYVTIMLNISFVIYFRYILYDIYKFISKSKWIKKL